MFKVRDKRRLSWLLGIVAGSAVLTVGVAWLRHRRRTRLASPTSRPSATEDLKSSPQGLTEDQAQARRRAGENNNLSLEPVRSPARVWRENVLTVFNLGLVSLTIVQFMLGKPVNGAINVGLLFLIIWIRVSQEMSARKRLADIEQAARPEATVIRGGIARSIDPDEIVIGDVLAVGAGDEIVVDGRLLDQDQVVVDEMLFTGQSTRQTKSAGSEVLAGSFCVSGRALYRAERVGRDRRIASLTARTSVRRDELTALERLVNPVLYALLAVALGFVLVLVLSYFRSDVRAYVDEYVDVIGVVSGLAPAGLYFTIFLTYTSRVTDLAKAGALVYRARSIESLANATVLCFARSSSLFGTRVWLEPITPPTGQARLSDSRIRQILGDLARSSGVDSPVNRFLADSFEGTRRNARQEAPFLSAYGWSATVFDDDDLRGVYVLGEPEVLVEALASVETPIDGAETKDNGSQLWQKALASLAEVARRARKAVRREPRAANQTTETASCEGEGAALSPVVEPVPGFVAEKRIPPLRLLRERLASRRKREKAVQAEEIAAAQEPTNEGRMLLFAYCPKIAPLADEMGQPQLPKNLVLLGQLHFSMALRPESVEMLRAFAESGVRTKFLTTGPAEEVVALLQNPEAPVPLPSISGEQLAAMDAPTFARTVAETPVFGTLSPEQAIQVVRTLRDQGEAVAVVGDRATDVPVLRQATLAIARRRSSPAAIAVADLVLLDDAPKVLPDVLEKGQRIANGVLDILKLNLTQAFYLLLLIVSLGLLAQGFPYRGPYGTAVNLLTTTIPSIALIVWARPRVLPRARLGWLLARFVAPASSSMAAVAAIVYSFFEAKSGRMGYAQLAVTNFLAIAGLLLVVFLKPPRNTTGERKDWRSVRLTIILLALFLLLPAWSFTQDVFMLDWLRPSDYWVVGLAVAAWTVVINVLWWLARLLMPGLQSAPETAVQISPGVARLISWQDTDGPVQMPYQWTGIPKDWRAQCQKITATHPKE